MVVEVTGDQRDIDVPRFAYRFAVVQRLQYGQLPAVLLHQAGQCVQVPGARVRRKFLPARQRRAGGADRCIDVGHITLGELCKRLSGGGVVRFEQRVAGQCELAIDEMSKPGVVLRQPGTGGAVALRSGSVIHGVQNVPHAHG